MIHSTKDADPKLRFELYRAAMKVLRMSNPNIEPAYGWQIIRAEGKEILKDWAASDSECAAVVIMNHRK